MPDLPQDCGPRVGKVVGAVTRIPAVLQVLAITFAVALIVRGVDTRNLWMMFGGAVLGAFTAGLAVAVIIAGGTFAELLS